MNYASRCYLLKQFLVFRCIKCRNFTTAPAGQKHRRCSYCGKIIDITKSACAVVNGPEAATIAVKEYNAARGGDEFQKAVEQSREKVLALMPSTSLKAGDIITKIDVPTSSGKGKRLLSLLRKEAIDRPCSFNRLEELCGEYQLEWSWIENQLTKLSNNGTVLFPKPWLVQLIQTTRKTKEKMIKIVDVSTEILILLRDKGKSIDLKQLIGYFKNRGITQESVELSLNKLMKRGEIFEPKSNVIDLA